MDHSDAARTELKGLPLSQGVAFGSVCMFNDSRHNEIPVYRVRERNVETEKARLLEAIRFVRGRLDEIRENVEKSIGPAEAEIFTAQIMILEDPSIRDDTFACIARDRQNAEVAISTVLDRCEARMLELANDYVRERASDIGEVKRRVLDALTNTRPALQCAGSTHCVHGSQRIVVAEELLPTLTVDLDLTGTLGFLTERGGVNSHAAILARALGIPAVSGLPGIRDRVTCGTPLLVNGDSGEVILWPDPEDLPRFQAAMPRKEPEAPVKPVQGFPVRANISTRADLPLMEQHGAEGVGLYRTEFEFITAGRRLSVDEQVACYVQVLEAAKGEPVSFRLIDAGGDKPLGFLQPGREDNPALGWRGMRLLLGTPDLLRDQLCALARASSHGPVRVLAPMITDFSQYEAFRAIYDEVLAQESSACMEHGVMFEVPSACMQAEELLDAVDFASVGTNDLVQYLFAVDRNNDRVAADYHCDYPVFWRVLEALAAAGRRVRKPVCVCGEMVALPENAQRLHSLGFSELSVSPRMIPLVRRAIHTALLEQGGASFPQTT